MAGLNSVARILALHPEAVQALWRSCHYPLEKTVIKTACTVFQKKAFLRDLALFQDSTLKCDTTFELREQAVISHSWLVWFSLGVFGV